MSGRDSAPKIFSAGGIYDKDGKCISWHEEWAKVYNCPEENYIRMQMKAVYQWRYKNPEQKHWKIAKTLLTVIEAHDYFAGCDIAKHAGPFEVPL